MRLLWLIFSLTIISDYAGTGYAEIDGNDSLDVMIMANDSIAGVDGGDSLAVAKFQSEKQDRVEPELVIILAGLLIIIGSFLAIKL